MQLSRHLVLKELIMDEDTPDSAKGSKPSRRKEGRKRPPETLKPGYVAAKIGTYFLGARYNDLRFGAQKRRFAGALPMGKKAAVYLIFPSQGLLQSHLDSLGYIAAKGYAPVVVSNVPLRDADRQRLLPHVATYIERTNFGYDFGGYRDGVLELQSELPQLERLVLLNDSSWFPLPNGGDWIADAETIPCDYVGATAHYCFPMPAVSDFRSIKWNYDDGIDFFHYTSFALMFGPAILRTPAFVKFWKSFPLTSIKRLTVRRGEVGLTKWVRAQGFTHGKTLDLSQFDKDLAQMPEQKLREMMAEMPVFAGDIQLLAIKQRLLDDAATHKSDLICFILTSVARQGPSYALVEYLAFHRGFAFLKKSPCSLMANSADIMRRVVARLDGPLGDHIRAEAQDLFRKAPLADEIPADLT